MRIVAAALLALSAGCGGRDRLADSGPAAAALVLEHVTVIDGSGAPPLPDRTIVVAGERILAVYASGSRPAPRGARVLDLSGRFVLPGLIDAHVHLKSRARDPGMIEHVLAGALRSGVTTVRDMGGNGAELAPLARRVNSGETDGPEILYSTLVTGGASRFWREGERAPYVSNGGTPGDSPWFRYMPPGSAAGPVAAEARRFGATGIKVHSGLDAAELGRLGRAARRAGLRFWSHAHVGPARAGDAVAAGVEILSHADMLAYEGLPPVLPADVARLSYVERTRRAMAATPVEGEALGRLFRAMRARSVCLEPTLFVMGAAEPDEAARPYIAYVAAATARAHRLGVPICTGTDAIGGSTANLPAELELLSSLAGLTPLAAIRAATFENARALRLADRGLIARGRRADLLVLGADPSRDLANLRAVDSVYLRGRLVSRR